MSRSSCSFNSTQNTNLFTREATSALGKVSEWQLDFSSRWKKLERYFRCTLTGIFKYVDLKYEFHSSRSKNDHADTTVDDTDYETFTPGRWNTWRLGVKMKRYTECRLQCSPRQTKTRENRLTKPSRTRLLWATWKISEFIETSLKLKSNCFRK